MAVAARGGACHPALLIVEAAADAVDLRADREGRSHGKHPGGDPGEELVRLLGLHLVQRTHDEGVADLAGLLVEAVAERRVLLGRHRLLVGLAKVVEGLVGHDGPAKAIGLVRLDDLLTDGHGNSFWLR